MTTRQETVQAIQAALEPFVRPREEATRIRAVLTAQIGSCLSGGPVTGPLGLADAACTVEVTAESRGLQREYLKAVAANVQAQGEYEAVKQKHTRDASDISHQARGASDRLEEHLSITKLQKKRERLLAIVKSLDLLGQKPAASQDFLNPDEVFRGSLQLPEVPKNFVHGLVLREDNSKTDLKALVDKLEKSVLRTKLLLKKEEQLLEGVKNSSSAPPGAVSDVAKHAALNATRNELINWIETELGKVSSEESGDLPATSNATESTTDRRHVDDQLVRIKKKYDLYIEARKSLVQLVSLRSPPVMKPPAEDKDTIPALNVPERPILHLISPYVENLLLLSHEQKASIAQKSHLNIALSKQTKDTCQTLDHLAEESQLLLAHSAPGAAQKKKAHFGGGLGSMESQDTTSRVKGWSFAADSAKIATLEHVTERIEEGQIALEESMKALNEIGQFLTKDSTGHDKADISVAGDDIWLAEGQSAAARGATSRKRAQSKSTKSQDAKGIWSTLHGNLGLLNSDENCT